LSIPIKSYDTLTDLEKLSLVDLSYSRMDTYTQCPAKYFYSYIQKEPRQFAPAATLGNIVHAVLENCLSNDSELSLDHMRDEYDKNISIYDPDSLIPKELINAGVQIIDEFYDENSDKTFNIYDKEMPFTLIIGSYKVIGFIDRVDVKDDMVHIVDYKTGKWEVSAKEVPNNLQLGIYALAVSQMFPEKQVYAELHYLRSGRKKGHLFTHEDIDGVKSKIIDIAYKMISDINYSPTSNIRLCTYCDHAKSGACGTGSFRMRNNKYG